MVKCPNCGEEADSKFCPKCGEKLEKKPLCPHCNEEIEEDTIFCPECGKKIEAEDDADKEEKTSESKSENENKKYCPHCNEELDEDGAIFCSNCGKAIKVDKYSFNGIIQSINFKRLIIVSIIGSLITFVLGILLSYIIGLTGQESLGYPIALIIAIFLGVGFAASFFKDILNAGLTGIIIGFIFGLLSNMCIEITSGFKFSYQLFSGYEIVVFTILGLIFAFIANKFLRNFILKFIDVDNLF